ncbi:unnamed protein product [Euphydryas editha]|uniref:Gag-like protein n=1 Tax=Euphydryas editha TaxID=104508 RepID=A0AAU9V8U0_EUPED|nr:unnamed protein product [Euphydryas editha]
MHRTPPPTRATSPAPTTSTETPKKTRPVRVAEKLSPPPLSTLDITNKESYQETIRVLVEKIDNAIRQGKSVTAYNKNLILNTAAWIQEATTKYFQDIHPKENRQDTDTKEIQTEPEPKSAPSRQNQTGPPPPPAAKTAAAPDTMMEEINKRLQNIEMKLEKNMVVQRSYASVTAAAPQRQQARPTLHSMIISSKNEEHTSDQVLKKVRETINAKEGWVTVEKVRKVRDRKVVVGFASAEECNRVQNRFSKQETGLLVEALKNKDPLLVLKDVLKYNTDEDIIKAIRNQNRALFDGLGEGDDRLQIKYHKRTRNPLTVHVVLSASPTLWKRITEKGAIHIDLQRVKAEDQSPLVQCTRCLGFGHGRRFCKEPQDLCSHCGGAHLQSKCVERRDGVPPSCRNCLKAKHTQTEHNAFDHGCPVRIRWDDIARSKVSYC